MLSKVNAELSQGHREPWMLWNSQLLIGKLSFEFNKAFKHTPQGREEILAPATVRSDINQSI